MKIISLKDISKSLNISETAIIRARLASYFRTKEKYELPLEEGFVRELDYDSKGDDMSKVIKEMIQSGHIEGVIFVTQYLAAEGLRELKALKVQVPADVALVSYGQKKDFDLFEPAISLVCLPINEMGDKAVEILLHNMKATTSASEIVRLRTELIVRKSCGAD